MVVNLNKVAGQAIGIFGLFALALFLPAGTVNWTQGWVFLGLFFAFYVGVTAWLLKHNPALVTERSQFAASNQKGWDRFLFPLLLVGFGVWLMVMGADAVRFGWSQMPLGFEIGGAILLLVSFYVLFLTFRENTYLSTVVRIQDDRGHKVIATGPYHVVRHPMYTGILVFVVGTSFLLGSWYGLGFGLLLMGLLARRAVLEEGTLQKELDGYDSYMGTVRYRLIPFVW